jgi:hypothetical protein
MWWKSMMAHLQINVTEMCMRTKAATRYRFKLRIKYNRYAMCGNHIDSRGEGEVFIFLLEHQHAAARNSLIDFFLKSLFLFEPLHILSMAPNQIPQHIVMTHLQKLYARSGGVHS